ncbi:hypothetical protein NF462_06625 [Streptococcus suis]|uniref:hypothetical protein n=1 Tax=Streptococcus suis TaxID=1307 RepID=UPI002118C9C8|nr:hypothetical protein [Streptococcus suis]MCQ8257227.1 hypothetical protein [Streptococcus suis]
MKFLLMNVRRTVFSKKMLLSFLLAFSCILIGNMVAFNGIYKLEGLSLFFAGSTIRGFSPISLVAAVISAIPIADRVIEDSKNHFLRLQLQRTSRIKYIWTLLVTAGISGFLSLFLPYFLLLVANLCLTPYKEIYIGDYQGVFKSIFDSNQLVYSILITIWYGIFGSVFAVFGLASSLAFRQKIVEVFFPCLYMILGGLFFALLDLSFLEPVGIISWGYQFQLNFLLVFLHLLCIFTICLGMILYHFQFRVEDSI